MNYRGEVTTKWGDGEHTFMLSVAGILELEEKTKAPFAVIFSRINAGEYGLADVSETLRLGMIGGGKTPIEAKTLVDRYLLPMAESAPVARMILLGVMFGFEAAPLGKAPAAPGETETTSPSMPPKSPEAPDLLELAQTNLEELRSGNWWQS